MSKQERIQKPQARDSKGRYTSEHAPVPAERDAETAEKLADTDALLDEIDAVLDDVLGEESAQEFVANYRQKGGE